jgi:gamma-glutamylcyclotransferase (GGCT)/AIG2-like uncharacterized protein YtfP
MNHYYFAYGANTNLDSMAIRCPGAKLLGTAILYDCRIVFRQHCDVESSKDSNVEGVLWQINEDHLYSLDQFEGYPVYYERDKLIVFDDQGYSYESWVYFMQSDNYVKAPSPQYWDLVKEGYQQNGINIKQLEVALKLSTDGSYDKD